MNGLLSIEHLSKSFDGVTPIRDATLSVNRQSIVLLSGENGAGKTTLFNLITGLERPTSGKIIYDGTAIETKSALEISRLGIARLYQQPRLFRNLPVWENLVSAARDNGGEKIINLIVKSKRARQEDEEIKHEALNLLTKLGIRTLSGLTAGELSYGQQKLISFSMIAMNKAKLALLDEPFAGLSPRTVGQLGDMILQLRAEGTTFLIIEHNINKALEIATCHIEMKDGRIRELGTE